jgi:hypothetical protein
MATRTVATSETIQTYTLKLPEEFNIAPAYMVELPSGYTCRIYTTKIEVRDYTSNSGNAVGNLVKVPAWRCMIFNKRGTQPQRNFGRLEIDRAFAEPLNVRLFIEAWASEVAKKSKVEKTDEDFE